MNQLPQGEKNIKSITKLLLFAAILTNYCIAESRSNNDTRFNNTKWSEYSNHQLEVRQFASNSTYSVCFVPNGASCEKLLVHAIDESKHSIHIQAYSFTNSRIAEAIVRAFKRGVDVQVILDKSQFSDKYSSATFLKSTGITVVGDLKPAIAHNKVMIFDQQSVFTGSFNFTRSAQDRNAENGILISGDLELAKLYTENWKARFNQSTPY